MIKTLLSLPTSTDIQSISLLTPKRHLDAFFLLFPNKSHKFPDKSHKKRGRKAIQKTYQSIYQHWHIHARYWWWQITECAQQKKEEKTVFRKNKEIQEIIPWYIMVILTKKYYYIKPIWKVHRKNLHDKKILLKNKPRFLHHTGCELFIASKNIKKI